MTMFLKQKKQSNKTKFSNTVGNFKIDRTDSEKLAKGDARILNDRKIKICKYDEIHRENLKTLNKDTRLPNKNEIIKIRVQKAYNAFTFILAIKEKHSYIDELYILTFNINEKTLLTIFEWLKNDNLGKFNLIVSESVKSRMPKRAQLIKDLYLTQPEKVNVAFSWNHCKIALVRCGEDYYIIEGSGNYSDNEEVEQYIIENSKDSFYFDVEGVVKTLIDKAIAKKRSNRGEMIWAEAKEI